MRVRLPFGKTDSHRALCRIFQLPSVYKRGVQTFLAFLQDWNEPSNIDVSYDVFPIPKNNGCHKTEC